MRLFAALSLPDAIRDRLVALQSGAPAGRAVPWESLHLTLGFFGDVEATAVPDLHDALARISAPAFDLMLDGAGAFGGDKPRLLYASAQPHPALIMLEEKVRQAARSARIDMAAKRFVPHVTLIRLRPHAARAADAAKWLAGAGAFMAGPIPIRDFALYESRLFPGGPVYAERARYALCAPVGTE